MGVEGRQGGSVASGNGAGEAVTHSLAVPAGWSPDSWRNKKALQQPRYEDSALLAQCLAEIRSRPPLVHPGEIDSLKAQMAEAGEGRRFVLQAGDCAERFVDCNPAAITDKLTSKTR